MTYSKLLKSFFALSCCLLFMGIASESRAQVPGQPSQPDTTSYQFWYSKFDARSMAMANTMIADRSDAIGLYSNPGLLPYNTDLTDLSIHSVFNSQNNILTQNVTAPLLRTEKKQLLLGATVIKNAPSGFPAPATRKLSFTQFNVDVAYGQIVMESLSLGAKLNFNYGKTNGDNKYTANSRVGLVYAPTPMVSYGIVYKGTGFRNDWFGSGISYYQVNDSGTQIRTAKLPHRLEIGTTLRFPSLAQTPDFVLNFSNEKLFGEPGVVYRGGLEIYPIKSLAIRGGYFYSEIKQGGRVGVGLNLSPVDIHYTYAQNNLDLTGTAHLMSIDINL